MARHDLGLSERLSQRDAERLVSRALRFLALALTQDGDSARLPGFGTLAVRRRAPKRYRLPRRQADGTVQVVEHVAPARLVVVLRPLARVRRVLEAQTR